MNLTENITAIFAILFGILLLKTEDSSLIFGICNFIFNFAKGLLGF